MNTSPRVSIVVPVYNCEAYIEQALRSALDQSYRDLEVVVVDNHSTDGTIERIGRITDSRLRVQRNPSNLGAEANWNLALAAARGELVKLLCADDLLYSDCISRQVAILDAPENRSVALVCSRRDVIGESGAKMLTDHGGGGLAGLVPAKEALRAVLRSGTNLFGEPASVLFRKSASDRAGLFSARIPYMIDLDYWCRLLREGDLYFIPEPLCAFRVSALSWSVALARKQSQEARKFLKSLHEQTGPGNRADYLLGSFRAWSYGVLRQTLYASLRSKSGSASR